jgi:hypothetical protein
LFEDISYTKLDTATLTENKKLSTSRRMDLKLILSLVRYRKLFLWMMSLRLTVMWYDYGIKEYNNAKYVRNEATRVLSKRKL